MSASASRIRRWSCCRAASTSVPSNRVRLPSPATTYHLCPAVRQPAAAGRNEQRPEASLGRLPTRAGSWSTRCSNRLG